MLWTQGRGSPHGHSPTNTFLCPPPTPAAQAHPELSLSVAGISVTQARTSEMTVGSDTSCLCYPHSRFITNLTSSHKATPILSLPPALSLSELFLYAPGIHQSSLLYALGITAGPHAFPPPHSLQVVRCWEQGLLTLPHRQHPYPLVPGRLTG